MFMGITDGSGEVLHTGLGGRTLKATPTTNARMNKVGIFISTNLIYILFEYYLIIAHFYYENINSGAYL